MYEDKVVIIGVTAFPRDVSIGKSYHEAGNFSVGIGLP
jgi:hypothetical protein